MKIIRSLGYAISGLKACLKTQTNFRTHLLLASIAVAGSVLLRFSLWKWVAVLICIGVVLTAELLNTAIEILCDVVNPGYHPQIKVIKDMAAGAVVISALISFISGLLIFIPAIINRINS